MAMAGTGKRGLEWRTQNAGRMLSLATAEFERDVIHSVQKGEFNWVTRAHLALFRNLDIEGTTLTELAARAGVTKQSMQEIVDRAEAYGVVERRSALGDRRAKIVAFSDDGLRMLDEFRKGVLKAERRLAAAIGQDWLLEWKTKLGTYIASRHR